MKKFPAFLVAAFLISACGFRPLYGNINTLAGDSTSLDNITIDQVVPNSESGLNLKNALIDRFYHHGYPANPQYVLKITLIEAARNIIIQKDDTTTRSQLVMNATYEMDNRETRQMVDHGVIRAVGAYNVLESQYTTLVTQDSARQAAIRELADKIELRMAVVLETGHGTIANTPIPPKNTNNILQPLPN
jgi:LPS-assembly lipoprotein